MLQKKLSPDAYDLVVIGGGSGGLTAAISAGEIGAKVLLVDRESLGGDCLHTGCVPSKALLASAHLAHRMRHAADFGLGAVDVKVDFGAVMARVRRVQAEIGEGESPAALAHHGVEVAFGGASFLDAHRVRVGEEREVRTKFVILATGSRAAPPPIEGVDSPGVLDHVSLFQLEELPRRLCVVGGGCIGVEMGQAFSRLGAEVMVVERGARVLSREEPVVSALLLAALREEGVDVRLSHHVLRIAAGKGGGFEVRLRAGEEESTLAFDAVLVATGRRPNIESLKLEAAGVRFDRRGVKVDESLRTSQSHIFAVGDVARGRQFTHQAEHDARVATRNALFVGSTQRRGEVPWCTFTDPEVARVGLTLDEARRGNSGAHVHEVPFAKADRVVCEGEPAGLARVVVDAKERILGVHLVGAEAGELIAEWVLAMDHGLNLEQVGASVHAYPTRARVNRRLGDERFFAHGAPKGVSRLLGCFVGRDE